MYHVFTPAEFARGEKVMLWPGRFDMACRKPKKDCIAAYPQLSGPIWEMTRMFRGVGSDSSAVAMGHAPFAAPRGRALGGRGRTGQGQNRVWWGGGSILPSVYTYPGWV